MTFIPKTAKIQQIAESKPEVVQDLDEKFSDNTILFIDWANALGWQNQLERHISTKRLKQFFTSFSQIKKIYFYHGTLENDETSLHTQGEHLSIFGSGFVNKPVKIMHRSIDMTSIEENSKYILRDFLSHGLMKTLSENEIVHFNKGLKLLNDRGITTIEERKCNFDVELGVDMLTEWKKFKELKQKATFMLWSGDSDFYDIVQRVIKEGCGVIIGCTARRLSKELSESEAFVYEIQKIKNFICFPKEMDIILDEALLSEKMQKGDS